MTEKSNTDNIRATAAPAANHIVVSPTVKASMIKKIIARTSHNIGIVKYNPKIDIGIPPSINLNNSHCMCDIFQITD